jgi:hypothetical protein
MWSQMKLNPNYALKGFEVTGIHPLNSGAIKDDDIFISKRKDIVLNFPGGDFESQVEYIPGLTEASQGDRFSLMISLIRSKGEGQGLKCQHRLKVFYIFLI